MCGCHIFVHATGTTGFPGGSVVKKLPAVQETGFDPWVGSIPWRMKWQPTLVFLPGESHGQLSLEGYSPWGHKTAGQDLTTEKKQLIQRCRVMERGLYHQLRHPHPAPCKTTVLSTPPRQRKEKGPISRRTCDFSPLPFVWGDPLSCGI